MSRALIVCVCMVGCSLAVALGCMSFTMATADSTPVDPDSFGIERTSVTADFDSSAAQEETADTASEAPAIQSTSPRNIEQGVNAIIAEEKAEENEAIERADENRAAYLATYGSLPAGDVDFTVGREAFIAEWGERINAYMAGYPLEGHGEDFAAMAWEVGIDPRWSPAISNTESSRGQVCFAPCNAWGWGDTGFSSWTEAIRAHVSGLAKGYGFTISPSFAATYCPPNAAFWYAKTLAEMMKI